MLKEDRGALKVGSKHTGWDDLEYVTPTCQKPPFYTPQEVYMTGIYDEMPRMTSAEIEEWRKKSLEGRIRDALKQVRLVRSTITDLANVCSNHDVISADGQVQTLECTIERIIDELSGE